MRTICWFSAGAASAVATKLAMKETDVQIVYTNPGSEHPDNQRFIKDCERWFGQPIIQLKSERYENTWDVWEKTRFLVGPTGARCTAELKKRLRHKFERPDDIQVFGYTAEEKHRADRFIEQNPGVTLKTPLIERSLTKDDCLAIIDRAGIDMPAMYQLGYRNNNCVGCVKGGMGYWNKLRIDFPEVFDRMSNLERTLGNTVLRDDKGPVWLDELDSSRGNMDKEPNFECSLTCIIAENEIQ